MMKRILSTLLLLFLCAPIAAAQTGTVAGTVTDAESGESLPGVNVVVDELDLGAATDPDGAYEISDVPAGTYTLRVSFVGYKTFETEITVEADEDVTQNIELESESVDLDEVVVTGYGTEQSAGEVTGSVSNLSQEG
ncbi:MAG: carboxypeptidase-like regulatory domain-containing protein, partial [Salinibacter sp.]